MSAQNKYHCFVGIWRFISLRKLLEDFSVFPLGLAGLDQSGRVFCSTYEFSCIFVSPGYSILRSVDRPLLELGSQNYWLILLSFFPCFWSKLVSLSIIFFFLYLVYVHAMSMVSPQNSCSTLTKILRAWTGKFIFLNQENQFSRIESKNFPDLAPNAGEFNLDRKSVV